MFRSAATSVLRRAPHGLARSARAPLPAFRPRLAAPPALSVRILHSANGALRDRDKKLEEKVAHKKLESHPEEVTSTSTVRPLIEQDQAPRPAPDMSESLKKDINVIVDTVALRTVPRTAHLLGLAGTLPYMATSLTTLYLGWDLRQTWAPGLKSLFLFSHENAQQLLAFLEPVQLGYGAVIISFLGAIHWGMEFNERSPTKDRTRFRYAMGVVSPAIAWPTLMMPFEYALMSQMGAFTLLYFADTRAATNGWAPAWYGSYRFVLTFVVCTAIVLSLVGRQKVNMSSTSVLTADHLKQKADMGEYRESNSPKWERIEKEEIEKRKKEEEEEEKKKKEKEAEEKKEKKGKKE